MPVYVYRCDNCEDEFEIVQSIKDKSLVQCKKCRKRKLYRVPQIPYAMVRGSDRETVGTFAEKNMKKLGSEQVQKMKEKDGKIKKPNPKPWWRKNKEKVDTSLAKLTPDQKSNYIKTGKK